MVSDDVMVAPINDAMETLIDGAPFDNNNVIKLIEHRYFSHSLKIAAPVSDTKKF